MDNLKIKYGYTIDEYMACFGNDYENGDLWSFTKDDFENGAIEPDESITYWFIDGKYYETSI